MTRTAQGRQRAVPGSAPPRPVRRAWIAVALIPVAVIAAFVASEVLVRALGHEPMGTVPVWVDVLTWSVTVGVVLLPCTAAALYGRQARELGDRRGSVPFVLGVLAGLLVILLAVATIASTPHL